MAYNMEEEEEEEEEEEITPATTSDASITQCLNLITFRIYHQNAANTPVF